MTKHEVIKAAHVRNEQFIADLRPIIELVPSLCFLEAVRIQALSGEQAPYCEAQREILRVEAALAKVMMDRLDALFDTWPKAVWLFFPETGASGWIGLFTQFHSTIFPFYFPEAPKRPLWRTKRVSGHRWCGVTPRIRKESLRTFRIWDQFKAGRRPMEIVRREFPVRSTQLGRKSKKELMVVRRSLERASQLIYEQLLPSNRKIRRLLAFNHENHMTMCVQCRGASSDKELCQKAWDFVNQDQKSQRELPLSW